MAQTPRQLFDYYFHEAQMALLEERYADCRKILLSGHDALEKMADEREGDEKQDAYRHAANLQRAALSIPERETNRRGRNSSARGGSGSKGPSYEDTETRWAASEKPDVHFDDIAGLDDVKALIQRQVVLPRLHPEVFERFKRDSGGGVLLYGVPGTGKTMMAKAIATEVDAAFFSVRCSDIVSRWFGEAEQNVRNLFESARQQPASVIFFDEFEALAARRGGHSSVMNRIVPELLSQMDGFSVRPDRTILVLAATNRPWDLDTAFLRPPRLTVKIHVHLPDYEARLYLIKRAMKTIPCDPSVSLSDIANQTEGYSPADIVSLCDAIKDGPIVRTIERKGKDTVTLQDVRKALKTVKSSVQKEDVERLRRWENEQNSRI